MRNLITRIYLLSQRDSGQTMAEYAVVLSVIAISVFVALGLLCRLDQRRARHDHRRDLKPTHHRGPSARVFFFEIERGRRIGASLFSRECILPGCPSST